MLVGDVRWAAPTGGSSCTLSGGRWLSAGPTNVSKYRHVRRAVVRRNASSAADRRGRGGAVGRLSHHAIAGATNHSPMTGPATTSASGRTRPSPIAATSAVTGTAHIAL